MKIKARYLKVFFEIRGYFEPEAVGGVEGHEVRNPSFRLARKHAVVDQGGFLLDA